MTLNLLLLLNVSSELRLEELSRLLGKWRVGNSSTETWPRETHGIQSTLGFLGAEEGAGYCELPSKSQ